MKRILTAAALIPLMAYLVLFAPQAAFLAALALIAAMCYHEYSGLVAGHGIDSPGPLGYAAGLLLLLLPVDSLFVLVLAGMGALALALRAEPLAKGLPRAGALLFGVVYVFGAWKFAIPLRAASPYWLLFALALNWAGDIAAYYAGSAFGRHKLAPRVSPAKSWEGAAASVAASTLFGLLYAHWLLPSVPAWWMILLSVAGNAAGQLGDLAESAMKRGAGIKDSGNCLPGHGGWLDRVDSCLFSLPVVYWLLGVLGRLA